MIFYNNYQTKSILICAIMTCENVASDLELGGGFRRELHLQLASHELATIWHKCDETRNSKFQIHKLGTSFDVECSR